MKLESNWIIYCTDYVPLQVTPHYALVCAQLACYTFIRRYLKFSTDCLYMVPDHIWWQF